MQGHTRTLDPSYPGQSLEFLNITASSVLENFDQIYARTQPNQRSQLVADIILAWCQPQHPRGLRVPGDNLVPHWRNCLGKAYPLHRQSRYPLKFEVSRPNGDCVQTVEVYASIRPGELDSARPLLTLQIGGQALLSLLVAIGNKGLVQIEFDQNAFWAWPVKIQSERRSTKV